MPPGRGDARHGVIAKRKRLAGGRRANRLQSRSESVVSMIRVLALGLTVLTGFSALVYEVAWQKYLATLLGSHSEATAAVLGLFLGGLSLGYALFGSACRKLVERARAAGRAPRLLLFYGGVECGIGLWALLFPILFAGARMLSAHLPAGPEALGFAIDVALTALLIGPHIFSRLVRSPLRGINE